MLTLQFFPLTIYNYSRQQQQNNNRKKLDYLDPGVLVEFGSVFGKRIKDPIRISRLTIPLESWLWLSRAFLAINSEVRINPFFSSSSKSDSDQVFLIGFRFELDRIFLLIGSSPGSTPPGSDTLIHMTNKG